MISILIVDDDMNKISSIIIAIQSNYKDNVEIKQASNVVEALDVLTNNHFHLLITDLQMPLRYGEQPDKKGGETLLRTLYRKKNISMPIYIVGLTQFEEFKHYFSDIWNVWKFDVSSEDWKNKLRNLIFHISKVNSKIVKEKKETLFVEGVTDKEILLLAFNLFFHHYSNQVSIETVEYGGGSSWVERQLIIWGKTLFWKDKEKKVYLKAIGLFDNDEAGMKSIEVLNREVPNESAERKTFNCIKLDRSYAKHLIPLYKQGLKIPITLEEMYAPFCWEHAKKQGWLVERGLSESILNEPQSWDKTNNSLKTHLKSLALSDENSLLVYYKVNDEYKTDFVKYIKQLNEVKQREALISYSFLIKEILSKFKLMGCD